MEIVGDDAASIPREFKSGRGLVDCNGSCRALGQDTEPFESVTGPLVDDAVPGARSEDQNRLVPASATDTGVAARQLEPTDQRHLARREFALAPTP